MDSIKIGDAVEFPIEDELVLRRQTLLGPYLAPLRTAMRLADARNNMLNDAGVDVGDQEAVDTLTDAFWNLLGDERAKRFAALALTSNEELMEAEKARGVERRLKERAHEISEADPMDGLNQAFTIGVLTVINWFVEEANEGQAEGVDEGVDEVDEVEDDPKDSPARKPSPKSSKTKSSSS